MIDIPLGNNPFLTVTTEDLDRNIAEATERLKSVKDTYSWRRNHHYCVICGCKLPLGYAISVCVSCTRK